MLSTPIATGKTDPECFAARVVAWQRDHGRHDLPWQGTRDPYRIWLAEIMLQQTQVVTAIPYYQRFVERFPDVEALAAAPLEAVLSLWSGLGYYARARHLHRAAQEIVACHGGRFPRGAEALARLPGIGRSTAAAIAAFAWEERAAILDGNVKRVLARCFAIEGHPGRREVEDAMWALAQRLLPEACAMPAYTQGLMDLGATVCRRRRPDCARCPLGADCRARLDGRTAELPQARPARATPRRHCALLVIVAGDRVLLAQRPPAGIWGGLASLPELEPGTDPAAALAALCGGKLCHRQALPPLRHAFTHFTLTLQPILLRVGPPFRLVADTPLYWQALDELAAAPLPAPVRRILERLPRS